MRLKIACLIACAVAVTLIAQASSTPVLDPPHGGDRNVTGKATPGSAPVTIYELSGAELNYLGSSKSMDDQGNFAVAVTPLVLGKTIVAKDSSGRTSQPVVVTKMTGPAGEQ